MPILKRQQHRLVDILKEPYLKVDDAIGICKAAEIDVSKMAIEKASSERWADIVGRIVNTAALDQLLTAVAADFQIQDPACEKTYHRKFLALLEEIQLQTPEVLLMVLNQRIPAGECVLFLGPHAFKVEYNDKIISFTEYLSQRLAAKLDEMDIYFDPKATGNLSYLIDRYESRDAAIPGDAKTFANDCFKDIKDDLRLPLYKALENLNFPVVVNTNPEIVFGESLPAGKVVRLRYDQSNNIMDQLADSDLGKPIIYNIYGSFENPQSVIWTEKEAVNFTKGAYEKNPPINSTVKLIVKQRYGLFVGFDFRDWPLKILFDILDLKNKPGNYSVNEQDIDDQHLEYYSRQYNMSFVTQKVAFFKSLYHGA